MENSVWASKVWETPLLLKVGKKCFALKRSCTFWLHFLCKYIQGNSFEDERIFKSPKNFWWETYKISIKISDLGRNNCTLSCDPTLFFSPFFLLNPFPEVQLHNSRGQHSHKILCKWCPGVMQGSMKAGWSISSLPPSAWWVLFSKWINIHSTSWH